MGLPGADRAALLLPHYLEILKRITMQDSELVQLCKTIYRKHREAIDLVVQYGASSQVADACEGMVRQLPNLEFHQTRRNSVWFLPKEMAAVQRGAGARSGNQTVHLGPDEHLALIELPDPLVSQWTWQPSSI